jgi:predicted Zn finger-like uncharacterized protein
VKFVCDNCKAKYQIGDDKVAGKTLRMKCRRCGHMIQVAATVTESSVSDALPKEVTGSAAAPIPAGAAPRPPPPPRPPVPSFEAPDTNADDNDGATVVRPSPFMMAEAARAMKERGSVPAPPGSIASRASVPRIVPPARPSLRSAPPPAASAAGGLDAGPAGTHTVSSPGLYSGFAQAVAAPPSPPASSAQLPTEDWYVGIGGVPLGPVRLSVIRDKAAAGQVDKESLVWREGFDEWQPVRANAALLAMVEEAKAIRMSRTGMPAVGMTPGMNSAFGVTPSPRPAISGTPMAPPSNVAFNGIPDAAPSLPFDLMRSSSVPAAPTPAGSLAVKDPFAPAEGSSPFATNGAAAVAPLGATAPANGYGLSTTQGTALAKPETSTAAPISVPPPSLKKRKGLHPMAWAFIAMAAAFGGVAAWALLFREGKTEIRYVEKNGTAVAPQLAAAPPAPPTGDATSGTQASAAPGTSASPGNPGGGIARNPGTTSTAKPGETAPPIDTSGFGGVGGPATTGTSDNGGKGGELSEGEINGVVSRGKPGITRRCWTPAYDARPSDAPKSAKVNVTVKVSPSGSVSSATASGGGAAYPGLASCVQNSVKSWQFPPSDSGATVAIPFSFSGQ